MNTTTIPEGDNKNIKSISFGEKYNLQGHLIEVCAKTASETEALLRRCDYITKAGADWAKNCEQRFGQN